MEMEESSKIAKNTAYLSAAFVGQKILSFIYFTMIARFAGVEDTGKYFFALSFTTIFSIFVDLGLSPVLIREASKFKERLREFLNNILGVKIFLSIFSASAVAAAINILDYPETTRHLVYLASIIMVLDAFHLSFYGAFRSRQILKYEALGVIIGQFLTLAVGGVALYFGWPLYFLILAVLSNSVFNFIFSLALIVKKIGIRPRFSFDKNIIKFLFKIAIPFALAGIFVKVNFFDSVLLSILTTDEYVGWYSVPFKITFALQFIPLAFSASLYPAFSSYFVFSKEKLAGTFLRGTRYLLIISVPTAVGIAALADKIIIYVYGNNYAPSILPLRILIFALIPIFLNFPVGALLNACDKQMKNTINMGISTGLNIVLNLFLIVKFNIIGAAVSALVSHTFLLVLGMYWTPKIAPYAKKKLAWFSIKIIFSALVMGAAIIYLKDYINFIILIPFGALIFFVIAFISRAIVKEDVNKIFFSIFKKEKALEYEEVDINN